MNEKKFTLKTLAVACAAAMLGACGGGSDSGSVEQKQNAAPSSPVQGVSGKAIDGYLVGALVCVDENVNNVCDKGEPSAVTDAEGGFAIPYDGDITGQRLLAEVTQATRDVSRPDYRFPVSFTLSAIADGAKQNITPLTTMVVAQMEAGMSQAEAVAAVLELIGEVDLAADYVAQEDNETQDKAHNIVDKLILHAVHGQADADTVRSVLNAMVNKGDLDVGKAEVDALRGGPVYLPADASKLLATPLYSLVDAVNANLDKPVQRVQKIVDGTLQIIHQEGSKEGGSLTWQDYPTYTKRISPLEPSAQFVLNADGTWSDMKLMADWRMPLDLKAIGRTLSGTDPMTGLDFVYELRQVKLDNQPAKLAVAGTLFGDNLSIYNRLADIVSVHSTPAVMFPTGTTGYLGIQSFQQDYVVLPLGLGFADCGFPYIETCPVDLVGEYPYMDGYGWGDSFYADEQRTYRSLPPYDHVPELLPYEPTQTFNDAGLPKPLTSADQLVGLTIVDNVVLQGKIQISDDGQAHLTYSNEGLEHQATTTWSIYDRNSGVMVFDIPREAHETLGTFGTRLPLKQGAKLVLAVREGQLHSGLLLPAGYGQRVLQFQNQLPSVLTTARD